MLRIVATNALFFLMMTIPHYSHGQMTQNLLLGNAKALALGNAVTADPPGIDSIHFNPAGLARLKGRQYELKFIVADFSVEGEFQLNDEEVRAENEARGFSDPLANSKSTIDNFAIYLPGKGLSSLSITAAPLGGVSYNREGSKFTFANSIYAPMLLGMTRKAEDPGIYYGKRMSFTRITYFAPSVGYEATDRLSLGMSVGFSFSGIWFDLPYRAPNEFIKVVSEVLDSACGRKNSERFVVEVPGVNVCRGGIDPYAQLFHMDFNITNNLSTTINLGLLWDATDWMTFGITYQSEAKDTLKGDFVVTVSPEANTFLSGLADSTLFGTELLNTIVRDVIAVPVDGRVKTTGQITLVTPQHFAMGVSVQVLPRLSEH